MFHNNPKSITTPHGLHPCCTLPCAWQEAYEVLSDLTRRREYDSTDEFDDTLPTGCDPADFFKVGRQRRSCACTGWPQQRCHVHRCHA